MSLPLTLSVPFSPANLPVVTGFVETAAPVLGLSTAEAMSATFYAAFKMDDDT
ncbi:MAG: hypothetical protein HQK55_17730, partial [Deltaproteobacteria bacterium]|nr:hypothetical protein [Deltaproteobacteria bacterium]